MNFEINLIFLSKLFFLPDQMSKQEFKSLEGKKIVKMK